MVVSAALNVALHLAGLVAAVRLIRPGTPLVSLEARRAYLVTQAPAWSAGWGVWMLCALAVVAFFAVLAHAEHGAPLAAPGVLLATAGASIDLLCDALQVTLLPSLAAGSDMDLFLAWERALRAGGSVVANGLYSLAVLLMTATRWRRASVRTTGLVTIAAGGCMLVGGLMSDLRLIEWSTGPTILGFMLWTLAVTRVLLKPATPS